MRNGLFPSLLSPGWLLFHDKLGITLRRMWRAEEKRISFTMHRINIFCVTVSYTSLAPTQRRFIDVCTASSVGGTASCVILPYMRSQPRDLLESVVADL